MVLRTVLRPCLSGDGSISLSAYQLDTYHWNCAYTFVEVIKTISRSDPRLVDPTFLVIQTPLRVVVEDFRYLLSFDLTGIASYHGVSYRGLRKDTLLSALTVHSCGISCGSVLYVFKCLSKLRPPRAWNYAGNTNRWRISSSSTINKPIAIGNTTKHSVEWNTSGERPYSYGTSCVRTSSGASVTSLSSWETSKALRTALSRQSSNNNGLGPSSSDAQVATVPHDDTGGANSAVIPQRRNHQAPGKREEYDLSHLQPTAESSKQQIIREWQRETALQRFIRRPCAVCSALTFCHELSTVRATEIDLSLLRNDDLPIMSIPTTYNYTAYNRAILDPYGLEDRSTPRALYICETCFNDLIRGLMPKLALANWLYYAREELPPAIAEAFRSLSVFEKALISRVRTNSIFCRFRAFEDEDESEKFSARRRHIKGNIVSAPLDVVHVSELLPPSREEIADTLCALLISHTPPTRATIDRLHPILVRKSRVKLLIDFLLQNNPHYRLSEAFKGFSSEHLDALFTGSADIGIPDAVQIGHLPVNDAIESTSDDYTGRSDELSGLIIENVSYTLGDRSAFSYREMKLHALQHVKEGRPFLSSRAGRRPVPDIDNPNWLSWAHPNADPFGIGGFQNPRRKRHISAEHQLRHLLNVRDPFFENDPAIAFDVYTIIRKGMVNTSLRFGIPYSAYSRVVRDIASMDKTRLSELRLQFRNNPHYEPQTDEERKIIRTMTSISPVARRIPGSVAQRIKMRNEIRAIISQKGSPTLFVTINPADYFNPIVTVLANRCSTQTDIKIFEDWDVKRRAYTALKHPVACAQFFDFVMRAFVRIILRHGSKEGGIFGHCDSYYGTVETQGRGSLHCHMLVWLRGHLPPESLAETLRTSDQYRTKLATWLDSILHSGFKGSKSCYNHLPEHSRDDIGPSERHPATVPGPAIVTSDPDEFEREMNEYLDELLLRFNWHYHTGTCWKYLRPRDSRIAANCRFGLDGTTSEETHIDPETGEINLRRLHPRMTHYNPILTFLLKCNTDIKFVGSGDDAKAFLYYVTDYITKAPLSMHAGLSALSYAIRQGESRGVLSSSCEDETRRAMTIAVNSMLSHQEISHPQVMSFIMGKGECYTSEKFQALNWGEVLRYFESSIQRERDLDAESRAMSSINLSVTVEKGEIKPSNQLLDYLYRPDSSPFGTMNLYTFISSTIISPKSQTVIKSDAPLSTNEVPSFLRLHPQFHTHVPKMRRDVVIPVLLGPKIPRRHGTEAEKERWARDICILFRPWRHPLDLCPRDGGWYNYLHQLLPTLREPDRVTIDNMALLAEAKHARDERPRRAKTAWTHNRPQTNIDTVIDEALQEESREPNIFSALRGPEDAQSTGLDIKQLPSHMTYLLGSDASTAFNCYIASQNQTFSTEDEGMTLDPAEVTEMEQTHVLDQQSAFMTQCKLRLYSSEGHQDMTQQEPEAPNAPTLDTQTMHLPSTEVTTLRDSFKRTQGSRKDMWRAVHQLMQLRGLTTNPEQRRAFEIIAHHAIEGGTQLLMYIGGRGGCGKSYLIETVVALFHILGRSSEIRLSAPTGIASTLIGGNTIHSMLHIGPNPHQTDPSTSSRRLTGEWRNVKYVVVDETSMVGASFMAQISARLKIAKGDAFEESSRIFGGINMIFTGDFYQLAPPKQPSLFAHKLVRDPTFLQTRNNEGIDSIAGAYLWRRVETVVLLKQNKRQANDPVLAELLDRMRTNTCLDRSGKPVEFAGASAIDHLRRRQISNVSQRDPSVLPLFEDAPVIVGSKNIRDALNASLLMAHAQRLNKAVHTYYSLDFVHRQQAEGDTAKDLWDLTSRVTGESFGRLPLFVGMRVMVTENISIPFNIVNGSEGVITDIRYKADSRGRRFAVVVYTRVLRCHLQVPGLPEGIVPIFPTNTSIKYTTRGNHTPAKSFRRKQIPLVPAYSYTDYKSQGRTLERAVIDLASARGQGIYVMLSRVKSINGLLILRWFPESKILQRMSGELREELNRLERLDQRTEQLYSAGVLAPFGNRLRARTHATHHSNDAIERSVPNHIHRGTELELLLTDD